MCEERLNDSRDCDDSSDDGAECGVVLQRSSSVLLLCHANGSELVFEVDARRSAAEEGRPVEELGILGHAVLVVGAHSTVERDGLHGNQLQEVGDVIHF